MSKDRPAIPSATSNKVMKRYRHHCAICRDSDADPELHHIDETPSNNDESNLIPLCGNCHTPRAHTNANQKRLSLFRRYDEQLIFAPQFKPFLRRLEFLEKIDEIDADEIAEALDNLLRFLNVQEKGEFYAAEVRRLLAYPQSVAVAVVQRSQQFDPYVPNHMGRLWEPGDPYPERRVVGPHFSREELEQLSRQSQAQNAAYKNQLRQARDEVYKLVIEMLPNQKWDFDNDQLKKAFRSGF